jgi:hypothetical protein
MEAQNSPRRNQGYRELPFVELVIKTGIDKKGRLHRIKALSGRFSNFNENRDNILIGSK